MVVCVLVNKKEPSKEARMWVSVGGVRNEHLSKIYE